MSQNDTKAHAVERILIVDNEDFVLQALERLFYGEPFETLTASSAESAIQVLQEVDVSVLITDNEMDGLSGIDLLTWAHARSPNTVRIMLTGYAEVQTLLRAINEAAVFRFFVKPCDFAELKKVIHEALAARSSLQQVEEARMSLQREVFFHEYLRQHCSEFESIWRGFRKVWPRSAVGIELADR